MGKPCITIPLCIHMGKTASYLDSAAPRLYQVTHPVSSNLEGRLPFYLIASQFHLNSICGWFITSFRVRGKLQGWYLSFAWIPERGHKASPLKLQYLKKEVTYLGHIIAPGTRKLAPERVKTILGMKHPQPKRQVRALLVSWGFAAPGFPPLGKWQNHWFN